jgi:predicted ATP-grasp superfamily ATP-dependent carboligase
VRVDTSPDKDDSRRWLLKPLASGGGSRVREWRSGTPRPRRTYLQELAQGVVGSVAFVAAGGEAMPLAISRQLVGDRAFGATGYQYCGNILAASGESQFQQEAQIRSRLSTLVRLAAREFQLVGVNGIDFIARDSVPYLLEVNPRWTASMELAERTSGVSVFGLHAAACRSGTLPTLDENASRTSAVGKAIVYASRDVIIGDLTGWLDDESVRDIPSPGEIIATGRPICTVFAEARDSVECYGGLVRRAERVYETLSSFDS